MVPEIQQKRKRGRPRKIDVAGKQAIVQTTPTVKRKRGRPPKNNCIDVVQPSKKDKAKNENIKNKKTFTIVNAKVPADQFDAKLFINKKPASKQIKEFDEWIDAYTKRKEKNENEKILESMRSLQELLNNYLESTEISKNVFVEIPPIYLMKGEKISFVIFDPFDRGAEVTIRYSQKVVPIGATPAVKQTTICNKITESFSKYLPIGVCC
jgi:hypothetical protein